MRFVIQRVMHSKVTINGEVRGRNFARSSGLAIKMFDIIILARLNVLLGAVQVKIGRASCRERV